MAKKKSDGDTLLWILGLAALGGVGYLVWLNTSGSSTSNASDTAAANALPAGSGGTAPTQ